MKLVFAARVHFRSGELSEPSPSLVNCILGEDDVPGLKAAYLQAFYSPLECRPLYRTVQNTEHSYQTCENF
jgi:hypothetical protein